MGSFFPVPGLAGKLQQTHADYFKAVEVPEAQVAFQRVFPKSFFQGAAWFKKKKK